MTAITPEIDELEKLYDESNERCQAREGIQSHHEPPAGEMCPKIAVVRIKIFCDCTDSVRTAFLCQDHFDWLVKYSTLRCVFCGKLGNYDWEVI